MRRRVVKALSFAIVLSLAMPGRALADEVRSTGAPLVAIVRAPTRISLDLPALTPPHDRLTDGVRSPRSPFASATAREVRLSEDGWLVVGAAAVVGVLLLVIVVTGITN